MLNSSSRSYNSNSLKINAVTGAILKNHPKSWFERFSLSDSRANLLLCEGGHRGGKIHRFGESYYEREHDLQKDIIVLQMVICGDREVIAECIYRGDYEEVPV